MSGTSITRRQMVALGGAGVASAIALPFAHAFCGEEAPSDATTIGRAAAIAFARADAHFYDPQARSIRPTNGGGPAARNGLIDTHVANPALWQRESFANVIFNEWHRTRDDALRRRLLDDWTAVKARYTPGQLIGMAGGTPAFRIVTTFDDACWLCTYLVEAHMAGAADALGYLVEAIAYNLTRFADPDTTRNPAIVVAAHTPNLPNIDYATGSIATPRRGRVPGQAMRASRFGSLYTLPGAGDYIGGYGKCSSAYEAHMGLAALYAYERLGLPWLRAYAIHAQAFVGTHLLTPDPRAVPADPAHTPARPADRKAQYLVETEFCLATVPASNDPAAVAFRPRNQWYGKPVRSLDSTYFDGCLAFAVLSTRLHRLGLGDGARRAALNTAAALVSLQGYGRVVGGRTLIANTRDPHSGGHWAVPFVNEVLALPGAPPAVRRAFIDTGLHMAAHCLTPDGYVTADWAGPELNPVTGRSTWEEDYAARPGAQAGRVQIMTTSEGIAMLQACALAAG